MQNQYIDSALDFRAQANYSPVVALSAGGLGPDDFEPQLHLALHGPNNLVVKTVLRFEAGVEAPGVSLRLLARPGADPAKVYALPLAQLTASTTVALSVAGLSPGRYALWTDALHNFSATAVWLVDAHAGVRINLREEPVYVFTAVAAAPGRFWLHLMPLALPARPAASDDPRATSGWAQA